MYYLLETNYIISENEIKEEGFEIVDNTIGKWEKLDGKFGIKEWFNAYGFIKKQSDNVFDLIEVGDLVEEEDFNEIYKVKIFDNGKDEFRNKRFDKYNGDLYVKYEGCDDYYYDYIETLGTIDIVKIFKQNANGDYIKVWEKESE